MAQALKAIAPERGLVILYTPGQPSACPNCGAANWLIGRSTAECGQCEWSTSLAEPLTPERVEHA